MATERKRPVISDGLPSQLPDIDPEETSEWVESLDGVIDERGAKRARYVMLRLLERARERQVGVPPLTTTDYINTIPPEREPWFPGDEHVERRIRAYVRWNAAMLVHRAQRPEIGVGGHISTFASSASLYEVGFNHFFRGKNHPGGGDHIFYQGHASPGMYARAFLEGRLSEHQLDGFRQELSHPGGGLPSYPHPRLMPDFWEFPTVSMGLGGLNAIYQARFNRYLQHRGIKDTSQQHVWAFLGDGEMDEPETLGAIGVAAREELDNLTFVINCNLQRLDGPVRGNGKVMQELEAFFRGAGWNVIKVVWGREWDPLLAADTDGALVNLMNTTTDGDYQTYKAESGAYVREHFFGRDARTRKMVEPLSDDEIWNLKRGGHDYRKLYAAYKAATEHTGQPTVILAKTIKGWTLGSHFEGRNATHQMKKLTLEDLKTFRDRLYLDIPDSALEDNPYLPPYFHPGEKSEEMAYLQGAARAARRLPAVPADQHQAAGHPRAGAVRRHQARLGQAEGGHHAGLRPSAQGRDEGQGVRQALGADHPGRGPHLRPRLDLPDREDLLAARPALHLGRPGAVPVVQGVDHRADPARGDQRGRLGGLVHRGRLGVRHARRADDPDVHLLLDVRVPADRRRAVGGGRPDGPGLPARRHRRVGPRSTVRAFSTRTGTRC